MRLLLRFTIALVVSMLLVFAVHTVISISMQLNEAEESIRLNQDVMGRVLKAAVEETWERFGESAGRSLIEQANQRESQTDIRYVDPASDAPPDERPEALSEAKRALSQTSKTTWVDRHSFGVGKVYTYVPLAADGQVVGGIEIGNSLHREKEWLRERVTQNLATSLLVLITCSILAFALGSRLVAKPVEQLIQQAHRIGEGDFSVRSAPARKDELGQLAEEMNEMAGKLDTLTHQVVKETEDKVTAVQQLRHAERLTTVGKLAAGIAHELGTPLNVVSGRANRLAKDLGEGLNGSSALIIAEQADRMASIIRQLLDFARLRTPRKSALPIRHVCESTLGLLTTLAEKRGVTIELKCESDVVCAVDATQLQQVVTNLTVNAIQASTEGERVTVVVDEEVTTDPNTEVEAICAVIRVRDEGCGIPEEALPHIFEPFFTTKDIGDGTGLGLSVAYGIVQEHGGWIRVSSSPGHGSVFDIYLPRGTGAS